MAQFALSYIHQCQIGDQQIYCEHEKLMDAQQIKKKG